MTYTTQMDAARKGIIANVGQRRRKFNFRYPTAIESIIIDGFQALLQGHTG